MTWARAGVLLFAAATVCLAACSTDSPLFGAPVPTHRPLPTLPAGVPSIGAQAIEVRLVHDAVTDCVLVELNGNVLHALWPAGYGWNREQTGIQSADGTELALIGPPVRLFAIRGRTGTIEGHTMVFGPGASLLPPPDMTCNPDGDATMFVVGIA